MTSSSKASISASKAFDLINFSLDLDKKVATNFMSQYQNFFEGVDIDHKVPMLLSKLKILRVQLPNGADFSELFWNTRSGYGNMHTLIKILMCFAPSAASAERSFSALARIKTDKRTTMTEERLTDLIIIHLNRNKMPTEEDFLKESMKHFGRLKLYV